MSADELKAFVPGMTYVVFRTGAGMGGDPLTMELGADGKANGTRGPNSIAGDWKVHDAGRLCYSVSPAAGRGEKRHAATQGAIHALKKRTTPFIAS
jgi:hypothetical protein